jgi:hypothetical protein
MNSEYLLWFAALVVVVGAALLWLAIGEAPGIPLDDGPAPPAPGDATPREPS